MAILVSHVPERVQQRLVLLLKQNSRRWSPSWLPEAFAPKLNLETGLGPVRKADLLNGRYGGKQTFENGPLAGRSGFMPEVLTLVRQRRSPGRSADRRLCQPNLSLAVMLTG